MLFSTKSDKALTINKIENVYTILPPDKESLFNYLSQHNLNHVPVKIVFYYDKQLDGNSILFVTAPQQLPSSCKVIGILEGYSQYKHTFTDEDNNLEDDNNFEHLGHFEQSSNTISEKSENTLMQLLTNEGLLGQEVNVYHKHSDTEIPFKLNYEEEGIIQERVLYTYENHVKQGIYIFTASDLPAEVERYYNLKPQYVFVRSMV